MLLHERKAKKQAEKRGKIRLGSLRIFLGQKIVEKKRKKTAKNKTQKTGIKKDLSTAKRNI